MKKFFQLFGILLLGLVLFLSNAITFPHLMHLPEPTIEEPDEPDETLVEIDNRNHAVIEYGRPNIIKYNRAPLYTYIRFPQGGHTTDSVIFDWAHSMHNQISSEFQQRQDADLDTNLIGEINIQFDSFLVDNRYAGIFQSGEYSYYLAMTPEEIIETFNIDLERRAFLSSDDILDFTQSEMILDLLYQRTVIEHPDTEGHLAFIDNSWLSQVVISNEGIVVVLEQNTFLPDTFPTLLVTLPYDELGSALLIRQQPPLNFPPPPDFDLSPIVESPPFDDSYYPPDYADDYTDDYGDDSAPSVISQFGEIDPSLPMIAITFDDGPGVYTDLFLDLFETYGVRVTFFTVGNLINANSDSLTRASNSGHEIAGKSWDHRNLAKLSAENVETQLLDTNRAIEDITGTSAPAFFRPPFGAISSTMRDVATDLRLAIINWTFDSEDWLTRDPHAIHNAVIQNATFDGAIILNHETHISTLEAYRLLIPELLELGFQFVTVSEMIQYRMEDLGPGQVYGIGN